MKKFLLLCTAIGASFFSQAQDCSDIFISEYVEGTNNNKAIELYNPTANPIVMNGQYKMGRDRNGNGIPMLMVITGTIQPYSTRVFVIDKRDANGTGLELPVALDLQAKADTFINPVYVENNSPMYFNGDDSFVLVKNDVTILDIIGRIGEQGPWYVPGDPNTRWWTEDQTLVRKPTVQHGVLSNPAVFDPSLEWDSLPRNTYDSLGFHHCVCSPGPISVNEIEKGGKFSVYPNPMAGVDLAIRGDRDIYGYTIRTSNGAILKKESALGKQRYYSISMPEVSAGVYIIEVEFEDGTRSFQKLLSR